MPGGHQLCTREKVNSCVNSAMFLALTTDCWTSRAVDRFCKDPFIQQSLQNKFILKMLYRIS